MSAARSKSKPTRREPEHSVRIVYLLVNRKSGRAVLASLHRHSARCRRIDGETVVRCEVVETRRKGGGA